MAMATYTSFEYGLGILLTIIMLILFIGINESEGEYCFIFPIFFLLRLIELNPVIINSIHFLYLGFKRYACGLF